MRTASLAHSLAVASLIGAIVAGCGVSPGVQAGTVRTTTPTATGTGTRTPDVNSLRVRITRYGSMNPAPAFAAGSTNAPAVQRLYAATLAAPPYSYAGSWGCNIDDTYLLIFSDATGVVLRAEMMGNVGCPHLNLSDTPNGCRDSTDAYVELLAATLDVPVSDLSTVTGGIQPGPGVPLATSEPSATDLPPGASIPSCLNYHP